MTDLINYFLHSALCMAVFFAFFFFVLRKETNFNFNRFYLIGSSLVSVLIPFVDFYEIFRIGYVENVPYIPAFYLPEFVLQSDENSANSVMTWTISWVDAIIIIYIIGAVIFSIRLLLRIIQINNFIRKHGAQGKYQDGYLVLSTNGLFPTFSFKNYIFWDNSIPFTPEEKTQIFQHELVHVKQKHSRDILYFEILTILFWFNPIIRFYKNAIKDTHEFIADKKVAGATNPESYASLVVRQLFQSMDLALGSHFNKSQIKKRLSMITRINQRSNAFKPWLTLPILGLVIIVMGFNLPENYRPVPANTNIQVNDFASDNQSNKKSKDFVDEYADIMLDNVKEQIEKNKAGIEPGTANQRNETYSFVDQMPVPEGGMSEFYQFLQKNMEYPMQARELGIEGKVFVQFVVTKEGKLSQVEVLKGIGFGCDEEAVRTLSSYGKFKPGYHNGIAVNVKMIMPVTFKLPKH